MACPFNEVGSPSLETLHPSSLKEESSDSSDSESRFPLAAIFAITTHVRRHRLALRINLRAFNSSTGSILPLRLKARWVTSPQFQMVFVVFASHLFCHEFKESNCTEGSWLSWPQNQVSVSTAVDFLVGWFIYFWYHLHCPPEISFWPRCQGIVRV